MRVKKKFETGTARVFMSRKAAMKKLQLSLRDFRRLCILKGIYPREPAHKKKANKGSTATGIYYHVKDINFLANEPLINKFREYKIFLKKVARAKAKHEKEQLDSLFERRPKFRLDGIVKERYPTFSSALRDLDDALCMCFGFAALTQTKIIRPHVIAECRRLTAEFMHYVIESQSLRKAFISIKGIYYQAEIMGEKVTWIVGHERSVGAVSDVDFAVMANFVEFYTTMLSFVNFRLYKALGLFYPPQLQTAKAVQADGEAMELDEDALDKVYSLARPLARSQEMEPESTVDTFSLMDSEESLASKLQQLQILRTLFSKCRFFLNREVPKEPLTFLIRSCGGTVSWDGCPVMAYDESSEQITHHVIDRPLEKANVNRIYIQPQWVFDSFNAKKMLPTQRYAPGAALPPHLSPFTEENVADYVSFENVERLHEAGKDVSKLISTEPQGSAKQSKKSKISEEKRKGMLVEAGKAYKESRQKKINEEGHNLKLKEMLIAKRYRRAYTKIKFGQKREKREAAKLESKRRKLQETVTVE